MTPFLVTIAHRAIDKRTYRSIKREQSRGLVHWNEDVSGGDAAVDRARSIEMTRFLEQPSLGDVMCMVDDDIEWMPGDLEYLACVAHEHRCLVGGLVSKRAEAMGYGSRLCDGINHEIGSDELIELQPPAYLGGAMIAVARSVVEAVADGFPEKLVQGFWPFFIPTLWQEEKLGGRYEYLSEDWAFCQYVRLAGFKVYLAMRPVTLHAGFDQVTGNRGGPAALMVEAA